MVAPELGMPERHRQYFTKKMRIHERIGKTLSVAFMLWLISKKPIHGYEIIKILKKESGFEKVGASAIYPLLGTLASGGLVKVSQSKGGLRLRKQYSITQSGRRHLAAMKAAIFDSKIRVMFFREMIS